MLDMEGIGYTAIMARGTVRLSFMEPTPTTDWTTKWFILQHLHVAMWSSSILPFE